MYKRQAKDAAEASAEAKGQNPNALEYGTKQAQIEEFYITDDRGVPTNAILKGTMFTIHMKVRFMDPIPVSYTHLTLPTKRIVEISVAAGALKKKKETTEDQVCSTSH